MQTFEYVAFQCLVGAGNSAMPGVDSVLSIHAICHGEMGYGYA